MPTAIRDQCRYDIFERPTGVDQLCCQRLIPFAGTPFGTFLLAALSRPSLPDYICDLENKIELFCWWFRVRVKQGADFS